jgi:beta-lactamase regulating signal transducer with metallopeptidase domain
MNAPALLMALLNGAWQGAVLVGAAYAALGVFRRLNAATRYAIWSSLLGIALLLPAANYAFSVKPVTRVVNVQPAVFSAKHFASPSLTTLPAPQTRPLVFREIRPRSPQPGLFDRVFADAVQIGTYAKYALMALLLVGFVRLAFLGVEVVRMIAARRGVQRIEPPFELRDSVRRPYAFAVSPGYGMPCVLGFQPALIVIPEALLGSGNEKELLSVVLHEHEHVMRFDDVQNVLHRAAGAVGFFLPGVWLALRELAICREQICDDAAIAGSENRYAYARTLSAMAGWIDASPVQVPCFIFKRKQLLRRIEVLLDAAVSHSLRPNLRFALTAVGSLALIAGLVLRFQVPVFAERIVAPREPVAPGVPHVARVAAAVKPPAIAKPAVAAVPEKPLKPAKPAKHAKPAKTVTIRRSFTVIRPARAERTFRVINLQDIRLAPAGVVAPPIIAAPVVRFVHAHAHAAMTAEARAIAATAPYAPRRGGDLLDALSRFGYTNLSVDDLIALRDHGVSGPLVAGAVSYFGHPGASDLVKLADHGVSGAYLAELHAAGVAGISVDDVVRIADHGVSPMLIAGLRARGYAFNAETLVRLADHGVTIMYIDSMQRIRSNGRPSLEDLIRLHDAGFTP